MVTTASGSKTRLITAAADRAAPCKRLQASRKRRSRLYQWLGLHWESRRFRGSSRLRGFALVAVLASSSVCAGSPAFADDLDSARSFQAGDIIIRGRVTGMLPYNEKSSIDLIGGHVDLPTMVLPDIDVSYFLSERWSVTAQTGALNIDLKLKDTLYGDIDVGSVWSLPLSLAANYHIETGGRVTPYVGAGMVATWYFGEKPAGGFVQDFKVSTTYAPMVKAGFDYQITDDWYANFEAKQIFVPTQTIENQGVAARTSLNLFSVGLGVGYRF